MFINNPNYTLFFIVNIVLFPFIPIFISYKKNFIIGFSFGIFKPKLSQYFVQKNEMEHYFMYYYNHLWLPIIIYIVFFSKSYHKRSIQQYLLYFLSKFYILHIIIYRIYLIIKFRDIYFIKSLYIFILLMDLYHIIYDGCCNFKMHYLK